MRFTPFRRAVGPLLLALAAFVTAAPATAQDRGATGAGGRPGWSILPAPSDPEAIQGRWKIGGREQTITAGAFHDLHVLMSKLEGSVSRGVMPQQVWEHVLLRAEADALGIEVTDAMLDRHLQRDDADVWEGVQLRWKNQEVAPEDALVFVRDRLRIDRMKDEVLNTQRVTTTQAFDRFKQNRQRYKLEYVLFPIEDYLGRVDMTAVDDLRLRTFYTDDRQVQARYVRQPTVTAEIVFLDTGRLSAADAQRLAPDREVTREEALEYFWRNREMLMREFPPAKRHLLEIKEGTPPSEVVTPFSVLEDTIRRRLVVEGVLTRAREAAAAGERDLAALAERLGLGHRRVEDLPRARAGTDLREFGFAAFNQMSSAEIGSVSDVKHEGDVHWFFRLDDKQVSELPPFDEVKDELRDAFQESEALRIARDEANLAMTRINERVNEQMTPLREKLEAEAEQSAERRVRELGLAAPQDVQREKLRAQAQARQEIERERQKLLPAAFDAWVQETGAKVRPSDWFEFRASFDRMDPMGMGRAEEEPVDRETARRRFLEGSHYIRSLEIGQVAGLLLEDQASKAFFIVKLVDKQDPEIATMTPLDRAQAIAELTQLRESRLLRRWRYSDLQQRFQLELMEVK